MKLDETDLLTIKYALWLVIYRETLSDRAEAMRRLSKRIDDEVARLSEERANAAATGFPVGEVA